MSRFPEVSCCISRQINAHSTRVDEPKVGAAVGQSMGQVVADDCDPVVRPGYIFSARAKIADSGEWVPFIAQEDREKFKKDLDKARWTAVHHGRSMEIENHKLSIFDRGLDQPFLVNANKVKLV